MARTEIGQATREDRATGYAVHDPLGREVGRVEKLYVNRNGDPEYVMTKIGLLGLKSVLLPVRRIELDEVQRILHLK